MNNTVKLLVTFFVLSVLPMTALAQPTVTLTLSDGAAAEGTLDTGTFTVTRTNEGGVASPLIVRVSVSGNANWNTDFTVAPITPVAAQLLNVTIPANELSAAVNLTPIKDNVIEGTEKATFTLVALGTDYVVGAATTAEIDIADDPVEVNLQLLDGSASEQTLDTGSFSVTRTTGGKLDADLVVRVTFAGTANRGNDYTSSPFTVAGSGAFTFTIPAGELSASVTLTPLKDNIVEGTETANFTLTANGASYVVGAATSAAIDIADDAVEVNLQLLDGDASEETLETGSFSVTRTTGGKLDADLVVRVTFAGTANRGNDYTSSPFAVAGSGAFTLTIPANQTTASVTLTPFKDNIVEGTETATFTLTANGSNYVVGAATIADIDIADDAVEVSLQLLDGNASEQTLDAGSFSVTRTTNGDFAASLVVRVSFAGTASRGNDYTSSPFTAVSSGVFSITIPASQTSVTVTVTPIQDDNDIEGDETAIFTLVANGNAYLLDTPKEATILIANFNNLILKDGFEGP